MARLKTKEISEEIRTKIKDHAWTTFTPASIPTGQDPRRLTKDAHLPMVIVQITGTVTQAKSIGGGMTAIHGLAIYLALKHADNVDINMKKIEGAAEIFDFLCTNKVGTNYKLFINERGEGGTPSIDYEPDEERPYVGAGVPVSLVKIELAVRQPTIFAL